MCPGRDAPALARSWDEGGKGVFRGTELAAPAATCRVPWLPGQAVPVSVPVPWAAAPAAWGSRCASLPRGCPGRMDWGDSSPTPTHFVPSAVPSCGYR